MAAKKITVEAPEGIDKELFLNTYQKYMRLSKYLFGLGDKAIYNINEMPKSHEFFIQASDLASSLSISWENMTHEESNRIMLALLEDVYNEMSQVGEKERLAIEIKLIVLGDPKHAAVVIPD